MEGAYNPNTVVGPVAIKLFLKKVIEKQKHHITSHFSGSQL